MINEKYFSVDVSEDVHGWISVEDALPQKEGRYLCYRPSDKKQVVEPLFGDMVNNKKYLLILGVTHWQPLPEPPKEKPMTDTKRLDFIEKQKMEIRYADIAEQFVIGRYTENRQYKHWARNADLRTAIDEAMQEMRGLRNATTNN